MLQSSFSDMVIHSFATDANELVYPAITVCRHGYDPGLSDLFKKFPIDKAVILRRSIHCGNL